MGACLALYGFLKGKGQNATVIVPNDYPKFLKWMPENDTVLNFERENQQAQSALDQATVVFTLDFNDLSRTGQLEPGQRT